MTPRVSAIVVNFHSAALTRRAVASLRGGPATEIFVVDNSAQEAEHRRLAGLAEAGVQLIANPRNLGFGTACNLAYARARGEYCLLLNPDAYLLPGALETLVADLDRDARAAGVSPRTWLDDERRLLTPPSRMPSPWDEVVHALLAPWPRLAALNGRWQRRRALAVLGSRAPVAQPCLSGAHLLLRRAAVDAAGGLFDERFFLYFEDSDLCRRLRARGWRLLLDPRAHGVHHYDQCIGERPGDKARLGGEAHAAYLDKYDPRGRVRALAARLRRALPAARAPRHRDLGQLAEPPALPVPAALQAAWALEIAANERFVPAAVMFGAGPVAALPAGAWSVLAARRYWCRVGAPSGTRAGPAFGFEKAAEDSGA